MTTAVVISPHLDDAVLSLGGLVHRLVARGIVVHVVTAFAGDPDRDGPPARWDAAREAPTAVEVFVARRSEDAAAAAILGFQAHWLPFDDLSYLARRDPDAIWAGIEPFVAQADIVMAPGFPLAHEDHRYVTALAVSRVPPGTQMALYQEQPYASSMTTRIKRRLVGRSYATNAEFAEGGLRWTRVRLDPADQRAKAQAVSCYEGELPGLGNLGLGPGQALKRTSLLRREWLALKQSDADRVLRLIGQAPAESSAH